MMLGQGTGILGLLPLLFILILSCSAEAQKSAVLINCGAKGSANVDGREWASDTAPGNNMTLSSPPGIGVSTNVFNGDPAYEQLYKNARIFSDSLNYTFQGLKGDYFLRLHFYPLVADGYNVNESYFSVEANGFKLVSEMNVPGEISDKNLNLVQHGANSSYFYLLKEYFFSVDSDVIVVSFVPSKGSFGFVSAIEVILVGNKLFSDSVLRVGVNGGDGSVNLSKRGIETMYRLNVGGSSIKPSQDSFLWRTWGMDTSYMINADAGKEIANGTNVTYANSNDTAVAPLEVYETARILTNAEVIDKRFNMSWKLEIDPNFEYLIRLHFCELEYDKPNQRVFRIFINNKTATDNFDIYVRAGGMNKAYHEDFFDSVKSYTIWIQLGPDPTTGSAGTDALLNGLEIFKLSRNGNLAFVQTYSNIKVKSSSRSLVLWVGIGACVTSIAILGAICMMVRRFCKKKGDLNDTKKSPPGWRPLFYGSVLNSKANPKGSTSYHYQNGQYGITRSGRRFTLAEIRAATQNFDESLLIGVGGFGKVYQGKIDESTLVAIKRANPQSQQGLMEFETEIEMLSKLRHRHLVSLIGFCDEQNEMILIYEYMAKGTLRSHLFGCDLPPLSWKHRLEICIGAARGLHYLHTGSDRGIIHRDVKTTNILLDEDFVAKVADFGLSKAGPSLEQTHVSTAVKGSFGYLDPEYFRRQQLTEKSDVYSFGVVLFEVVCARAVINPTLPKDQINLAEWAMRWQRERSLERIIDPSLRENYSTESLIRFGEIAEKCLADEGKSRPTMGEVLWHLEYVLQLHDAWLRSNAKDDSVAAIQGLKNSAIDEGESDGIIDAENLDTGVEMKTSTDGGSVLGTGSMLASGVDAFSQMVDQRGR
ncbi:probable receptor-like protein kinase At1g30570 [Andrographis paniculata]|uniref:probable receptor-like protein kinase At1g30570 n=1 Tax=Andrographis paniculata TaxID=175694 RepID=UPI0021E86417|nr:probable receptor-like protein kinase At1g30570 [Andrographis paniculata]XP_051124939.1 probable receptor-like protein kinase At1g30570 [Andrographis paniculata]XP_051124940.1 probable receptor-like protein kinase At1g30570 [Andrographis paniculata]